ncbi:hypothetical protein [Haloferax sp. DFSO60]|uniref:hypothetical protein n=1 Tax=Haloferax sp. DFSO60 TaxID=3388652 RepID=UPI0039789557
MNRRAFLVAVGTTALAGCSASLRPASETIECPSLGDRFPTYCNTEEGNRVFIHTKSDTYNVVDDPSFSLVNMSLEPIRFGPLAPGRGLAKQTESGWEYVEDRFTGQSAQTLARGETWSWRVEVGYDAEAESTVVPIPREEITDGEYTFYVQVYSRLGGRRIIARPFTFETKPIIPR